LVLRKECKKDVLDHLSVTSPNIRVKKSPRNIVPSSKLRLSVRFQYSYSIGKLVKVSLANLKVHTTTKNENMTNERKTSKKKPK